MITSQSNPSTSFSRRILARGMAALALAVGALLAPQTPAQVVPKEVPAPIRGLEVTNHLGQQVPLSLQFKNEEGKIVSLGDYFNRPAGNGKAGAKKPVVVQMMYYRCPILCPTVLSKFTETLNQIDLTVGKDFDTLIVSIDPTDTPADALQHRNAQLVSYSRSGDAVRGGWNFLTGAAENSRALADALGFPYRYDPAANQYSHGAVLFILTPEGKVSRYLVGLNYPPSDVKLSILEAGGGHIGTWKDAFVLWCYHYNPDSGTYTVVAMRIMQVGGALSAIFIAVLLFVLWRFDLRRKRAQAKALLATPSLLPASDHPPTPPPFPGLKPAHR